MTPQTDTISVMKTTQIQFRATEAYRDRLREAAARRQLDMSTLIILALNKEYPELVEPYRDKDGTVTNDGHGHGPGGNSYTDAMRQ